VATTKNELDLFTRILHLFMMVCGTGAWMVSGWAEDYEKAEHLGFTIHSTLGMGLAISLLLRILYGVIGPESVRFSAWVPYTRERFRLVWEDIATLLRFKLPERPTHAGLSGLVQTYGLLVFSWSAITGSIMYVFLEPGTKAKGLIHAVKEVHEIGEVLIPSYLVLHVGAAVLHAAFGKPVWHRIFRRGVADRE
jgi:cytochrome b